MESSQSVIADTLAALWPEMAELSASIWRHPELAYQEHSAHDQLVSFAEKQGFVVTPHFVHPTAFKAEAGSGDGPHILFVSEYDALPNIGHACGHNLIAVVGAAAAVALARCGLAGRVTLLGTPAEEGGGGKLELLAAGALDGVDAAMMAHPYRLTAAHVPHMAMVGLRVRFHGRASHAAQAPWEGRNALDAAVMAYQGVACLRQQVEPSCRVHGVIVNGGAQANIVPDFTEMEFYVRAPTVQLLKTLEQKVRKCFHGAAEMTDCEVEVTQSVPMYADVLPNPVLARLYRRHAAAVGVAGLVANESVLAPSGSTDMGNVSQAVPALHPMFFVGTDAALHSQPFTAAAGRPEALEHARKQAEVLARIGAELMLRPELLQEAAAAFRADPRH